MKIYSPTRILLLLALFSGSLVIAWAQKPLIPRHPPAPSEYILGPGDQVSIHVVDLDDISDRPIRIDPNGYMDLPLIGRIEAGGLGIDEFGRQLRAKLAKYITNPQVSVNLVDNQSRLVSVIGSVNNPGVHPIEGPQHLIDAISMAGGVRADAGSRVILTRQARWGELPLSVAKMDPSGEYSTATLPLESLITASDPRENILIDPGDIISIPKADVVYVVGTVKKAGGFPLGTKNSLSVLQALSLAEGLNANASAGHARILRPASGGDGRTTDLPVNIGRILDGKDPDVPLYANDILYVPSSLAKSSAKQTAQAVVALATGMLIYR